MQRTPAELASALEEKRHFDSAMPKIAEIGVTHGALGYVDHHALFAYPHEHIGLAAEPRDPLSSGSARRCYPGAHGKNSVRRGEWLLL